MEFLHSQQDKLVPITDTADKKDLKVSTTAQLVVLGLPVLNHRRMPSFKKPKKLGYQLKDADAPFLVVTDM